MAEIVNLLIGILALYNTFIYFFVLVSFLPKSVVQSFSDSTVGVILFGLAVCFSLFSTWLLVRYLEKSRRPWLKILLLIAMLALIASHDPIVVRTVGKRSDTSFKEYLNEMANRPISDARPVPP